MKQAGRRQDGGKELGRFPEAMTLFWALSQRSQGEGHFMKRDWFGARARKHETTEFLKE